MSNFQHDVHIIGGGLAGCEAAWQLANRGIKVKISEMRGGGKMTAAHQSDGLAELVCSNSFRSDDDENNAVGLLHHEMRLLNSIIMTCADEAKVPAGSALAVDREIFSDLVEKAMNNHDNIHVVRECVETLPNNGITIISTGPLTDDGLAHQIIEKTGSENLAFFDAIAPIVHFDSVNMDIAWFQSRWDKGDGKDYINCPMDEEEYLIFHQGLMDGEKTTFKQWEENTPYFEGCMPIEVMASRGLDTLRFGPMKPVGLTNPATGKRAHAVVQLRQDNKQGSLWNMVGFQTKLKHGAQVELFRKIPGLENAEFARLGGLHRNSFIRSPILLDRHLRLKSAPHIRFAGQITGCEGYVESSAIGLICGIFTAADILGADIIPPNNMTSLGALLCHITGDAEADSYQPMNVNFGLFTPLTEKVHKKQRKLAMTSRAKEQFDIWRQNLAI
ncbi:methylenetetrahydrofolate--tRNA-(uracil(54)-C(5))-methyltransferase (FADH(2)-oxidizing) TrmFO [Sphingorhabdus lutea]|uniref:Methylenetetrahydrofolate--tRNA-(uracil-5-)-methyltransferase TrmFO n=1 Tax=Sphingorhabdus lutea TaxID=1913578 RepID=A0A1L3JCA3_9SPHN|nr:methylenetetrahydrofolate--tRNA-(uracil(54)-C(5))-methyltransferase (FADH(2)-oxidizing) TrmFO [Sphingorhabdus lutea]APG62729.1 methylenetetrahydrofolate--tRNA-(uracil(54)-C(5))-methyltransferase (FADH(2)-oxidizing) TrmFO [Sphingorhabdus lutea]